MIVSWLQLHQLYCGAVQINKTGEGPGNETMIKSKMVVNIAMEIFLLFQRLVVHCQLKISRKYFEINTENTQSENNCCQVMKKDVIFNIELGIKVKKKC